MIYVNVIILSIVISIVISRWVKVMWFLNIWFNLIWKFMFIINGDWRVFDLRGIEFSF